MKKLSTIFWSINFARLAAGQSILIHATVTLNMEHFARFLHTLYKRLFWTKKLSKKSMQKIWVWDKNSFLSHLEKNIFVEGPL